MVYEVWVHKDALNLTVVDNNYLANCLAVAQDNSQYRAASATLSHDDVFATSKHVVSVM